MKTFFRNNPIEDMFMESIFDPSILTAPKAEVIKTDDGGYEISISLLGFGKDEIEIETENDTICISGEIKNTVPKFVSQKKFKRSWELKNLDSKAVDASLENGILKVILKSKDAKKTVKKVIKIQ